MSSIYQKQTWMLTAGLTGPMIFKGFIVLRTVTLICKHCLKIHDCDVSSSFVADKEQIHGLKAAMHSTIDWFTFTNAVTVLQCSCVALIVTSSLSSESDLRVLVCFSTNARCNIAQGCVFSTSQVSLQVGHG